MTNVQTIKDFSADVEVNVNGNGHAEYLLFGSDDCADVAFNTINPIGAAATADYICGNLYAWDSRNERWNLAFYGRDDSEIMYLQNDKLLKAAGICTEVEEIKNAMPLQEIVFTWYQHPELFKF